MPSASLDLKVPSEFTQQDGETLECDKHDRVITCVLHHDLQLTPMFSGLYKKICLKESEVWLACSKRSDSGERCEVKIAIKSRGGLGREVRVPSLTSPPPSLLFFSRSFLLRTAPHYLNAWNRLSLAKNYFKQNYCHACHTRFAVRLVAQVHWWSILTQKSMLSQRIKDGGRSGVFAVLGGS